jgi:hypothetical protein
MALIYKNNSNTRRYNFGTRNDKAGLDERHGDCGYGLGH